MLARWMGRIRCGEGEEGFSVEWGSGAVGSAYLHVQDLCGRGLHRHNLPQALPKLLAKHALNPLRLQPCRHQKLNFHRYEHALDPMLLMSITAGAITSALARARPLRCRLKHAQKILLAPAIWRVVSNGGRSTRKEGTAQRAGQTCFMVTVEEGHVPHAPSSWRLTLPLTGSMETCQAPKGSSQQAWEATVDERCVRFCLGVFGVF